LLTIIPATIALKQEYFNTHYNHIQLDSHRPFSRKKQKTITSPYFFYVFFYVVFQKFDRFMVFGKIIQYFLILYWWCFRCI